MIYWIWLTRIPGIGPVLQKELLRVFKTPEDVFQACGKELINCNGLGKEKEKIIEEAKSNPRILEACKKISMNLEKHNIKLLTNDNPLYPSKAKELHDSPVLLYYKGTIRNKSMGVGIVGARRCTSYGKRVVVDVSSYLARQGIPVISGMAKGIDSYAHTVCIKEGGYTIAFLGNGLDICYPSEHRSLMESIIENGAIISEYPPGNPPKKAHFPKRNRLISSWSHKLLVVEAGAKSGTLSTAEAAKKYGRQVYAVPGEIYSMESAGCNNLIAQGVDMFLDMDQLVLDEASGLNNVNVSILDSNGICVDRKDRVKDKDLVKKVKVKHSERLDNLSELDKVILKSLKDYQEMTIRELSDRANCGKSEVIERLVVLEIEERLVVRGDWVRLRE